MKNIPGMWIVQSTLPGAAENFSSPSPEKKCGCLLAEKKVLPPFLSVFFSSPVSGKALPPEHTVHSMAYTFFVLFCGGGGFLSSSQTSLLRLRVLEGGGGG